MKNQNSEKPNIFSDRLRNMGQRLLTIQRDRLRNMKRRWIITLVVAIILFLALIVAVLYIWFRPPPSETDKGDLDLAPSWLSPDAENTYSVAWGDVDGDGDLDLAVGNEGYNKIYQNEEGMNEEGILQHTPAWKSGEQDRTSSVAWGDVDGDGDLDLAVGNYADCSTDGKEDDKECRGGENKIYRNDGQNEKGKLQFILIWTSGEQDHTTSIAWGDVDGDGNLDLAVGNYNAPNKIYLNDGRTLQTKAYPISDEQDCTTGVAWGDVDGDGDLDLAIGNDADYDEDEDCKGDENRIYRNNNGTLHIDKDWEITEHDQTRSVAWGDMDKDGDLDLVVGNFQQSSKIYLNRAGILQTDPIEVFGGDFNDLRSMALGDVDGDGDLDLAVGNLRSENKIYLNWGTSSGISARLIDGHSPESVAWGDVNNDGHLDLAVGNSNHKNGIYLYEGGALQTTPIWISDEDRTRSIAWGDVDGDGDLELAVGNVPENSPECIEENNIECQDGENKIYKFTASTLQATPIWTSAESDLTYSVAWGDVDGDGDLDLAVGNYRTPNRIYHNINGTLETTATWTSSISDNTRSVAWGDVDGDGDLDLAVGNSPGQNRVYLNTNGTLEMTATLILRDYDRTRSVAWGDVDGDGDLDLAVGNAPGPTKIYRNEKGVLQPGNRSFATNYTNSVAWGDVDGDGDLDLAVASWGDKDRVYLNERGDLRSVSGWTFGEISFSTNIAFGDADGDGDLDLAVGNATGCNDAGEDCQGGEIKIYWNRTVTGTLQSSDQLETIVLSKNSEPVSTFSQTVTTLAPANLYATPGIRQGRTIPFTYTLFHPDSKPIWSIQALYSLDGGGKWYTAVPTNTRTHNLSTGPYPTITLANTHVYTWDVYASDFFGQSDNVVFRLEAYPVSGQDSMTGTYRYTKTVPGPYLKPYMAAQTFPFRVRGNQIQVQMQVLSNTLPVSNALVYRLPATHSTTAQPFADQSDRPFRTDAQGYLQGRGSLGISDTLVALLPTSAANLITFTDSISLYYTSAKPITTGLKTDPVKELGVQTLTVSSTNPLILFNLDISLEWDAHRDERFMSQLKSDMLRVSELLFDWTDGQAALGEIRVYHNREKWSEADIRIYATNRLRPNAAQGGIVTTVITDPDRSNITYVPGQVRMGAVWNRYGGLSGNLGEDWPRALAHELGHYLFFLGDHYLGVEDNLLVPVDSCRGSAMADPYRDDYSEFHNGDNWSIECQDTLPNHETGRWDWQTITTFYSPLDGSRANPGPDNLPLAVTRIRSVQPVTPAHTLETPIFNLQKEGGGRYQPSPGAQAYLFQGERLIDLGSPVLDRIHARGAQPGDRLCVYEVTALDTPHLGCETVSSGDDRLTLVSKPEWQPDVIISPVHSKTITIRVPVTRTGLLGTETLQAQLFPLNAGAVLSITLSFDSNGYWRGTFTADKPTLEGYVRVWVDKPFSEGEPRREIVTDFALGGAPGVIRPTGGGGGYGSYGQWYAPAVSTDGQVMLYGENLNLTKGQFYALQRATIIPSPPSWVTVVGQAYRLITSEHLTDTSISFSYLERDVPPGEEQWLRIYYLDKDQVGATWQLLDKKPNTTYNQISAPVQGAGLYVLMSSIEIPLVQGWNLVAYPVQETRPVTEALQSIDGFYTQVRSFDTTGTFARWLDHYPGWANNSLKEMKFGQGYWIWMTKPDTLRLRGDGFDLD